MVGTGKLVKKEPSPTKVGAVTSPATFVLPSNKTTKALERELSPEPLPTVKID